MTTPKKDPLSRTPEDDGDAKLLADVKDTGWHIIGVFDPEDEVPAFAYTIGLFHNYRHPEIAVFGFDEVQVPMGIVSVIGERVKAGERFENCCEADDVVQGGYRVFFRSVEQRHFREFLGYARWFYDGDDFPVLQCVWPNKTHHYPWHPDASEAFRQRQPVLYDAASWQFQAGRNRGVFTTKPVIHEGLPILLVSHDIDGDWQFLCGTTNQEKVSALVSLGRILERDPSLLDLAGLPEGWQATRDKVGGVWRRVRTAADDGPVE